MYEFNVNLHQLPRMRHIAIGIMAYEDLVFQKLNRILAETLYNSK